MTQGVLALGRQLGLDRQSATVALLPGSRRSEVERLLPVMLAAAADREREEVPEERHVHMPDSTSFPSGHSASGFAFATAVAGQLPVVGAGLRFLAAAVAYSRVHTGVHYPGDAVVGSLVGSGIGGVVVAAAHRLTPGSRG